MKSAASATVRAGDGILARVRVPRTASADTGPRARADAAASLSRPRAGRLLDLRPLASLAGVGLLGSSPFTLVGDPAATFAPRRPSISGGLPFTGAASDLLALVAGGLLVAGTLIVRAARPATAATEGGEDR